VDITQRFGSQEMPRVAVVLKRVATNGSPLTNQQALFPPLRYEIGSAVPTRVSALAVSGAINKRHASILFIANQLPFLSLLSTPV
jgi:hypothetical protein